MKFITAANIAIFKNGVTSLGAVFIVIGGFLEATGLADIGMEVALAGGALAAAFARDGNKSSKKTGVE